MISINDFARNREKYLGKEDEALGWVDKGSQILGRHVQRHVYEIEGFRCKSLEEVERVAKNQGIPLKALDYKPEIIPQGGGKCDILVKFVPKHIRERRAAWG